MPTACDSEAKAPREHALAIGDVCNDPPSTSALPVQRCQWCTNCPKGACIPVKASCPKDQNCPMDQHIIQQLGSCFEYLCPASDCQMCSHLAKCLWTRHFKRSSELGLQGPSEEPLVHDLTCSATPDKRLLLFLTLWTHWVTASLLTLWSCQVTCV